MGILYGLSTWVPLFILKWIYYAVIYPYTTYYMVVWGGVAYTHFGKVLKLQKKAVRIITNSDY